MSNKNGTKTIQADSELVKEIAILAAKMETTRKNLIDEAIKDFLNKNRG